MPSKNKTIKFHGQEVENVLVRYMQKGLDKLDVTTIIEFDAKKDPEDCQVVNVQAVSEFVTITFYSDESTNAIIRRELIPNHCLEHIKIEDLKPG